MAAVEDAAGQGRRDYDILISLATREEAEVMASCLRAEGIDAFVGNTNYANLEWGHVLALGGLQVLVPAALKAEAKAILRARVKEWREPAVAPADDQVDEGPVSRRDRWRLWLIVLGFLGLWGLWLLLGVANVLDTPIGYIRRQLEY